MFIARTSRSLGVGHLRATFIVDPYFTTAVIRRTGLLYDSQFVPPLREPTPNAMLYLVLQGGVETKAAERTRHDGPVALVFDENTFEGVEGHPRITFCNYGEPLVVIELRVAKGDVASARRAPVQPLELPERAWRAARAVGAQPGDNAAAESATRALLSELSAAGVLTPDVGAGRQARSARHARLWSAVLPVAERLELLSSLDTLAMLTGLSVGHLTRELEAFATRLEIPFSSWRESSRRLRLKVAIMALSAHVLGIGEVARILGYGSVEAMARAFHDAGAPAPSRVREELRAARERLRA